MMSRLTPPVGVNLIPASKPELIGDNKQAQSNKKGHYGEYVIWILIALGIIILIFCYSARKYLDDHSGMVSALGTIAIMLLTIAYVRYSRHQWRVMNGQLAQMRLQFPELQKSAQAAKDSADALVASERAWIIVDLELPEMSGNLILGDNDTHVWVNAIYRNEGKTPAWVEEIYCKLEVSTFFRTDPDFASIQPWGSEPEILGAAKTSKPQQLALNCVGRSTDENCTSIYGVVTYRDMFGGNRSSTFGYMVLYIGRELQLKRLAGRVYNNNT